MHKKLGKVSTALSLGIFWEYDAPYTHEVSSRSRSEMSDN